MLTIMLVGLYFHDADSQHVHNTNTAPKKTVNSSTEIKKKKRKQKTTEACLLPLKCI